MKRYSALLALALVAGLLLAACGGAAPGSSPTGTPAGGSAGATTPTAPITLAASPVAGTPTGAAGVSTAPAGGTATAGTGILPSGTGTPAAGATGTGGAAGAGGPVNVAVVVKAVTSSYWKTVGDGVTAASQGDPNIKTTFLGPNEETDIQGQIGIIEAQISQGVDALAVAPSQADQVQPALQRAVDRGIPVVLIDTDIPGFGAKSAFVGTDNTEGGKRAGEYIARQLNNSGDVAIIRGAAGDPVHNQREQGARTALEGAGLKVVAVQPANSQRSEGQSVAENLLTANPGLKAIFATNDEMALGAATAAQAAGKDLVIVGFDASADGLQGIEGGQIDASVAQFPTNIGKLGVETAAKVARGQQVEKSVNTGVDLVTKDNLGEFQK